MATEDPVPRFKPGDTVRLRTRTAEMGVVTAVPRRLNRKYSYPVNFAGQIRNYSEEDLEPCGDSREPRDLFLNGSFGDLASCLQHLTYLRVSGGLSNYVYSFYSSKTQFFVHQFKPLVRFLDSGHGRLLLADEVGLGKTIEAGFILLEMLARRELHRALIICPAKLRNKWHREMLERFDIRFDLLGSSGIRALLSDVERGRRREFTAIMSYETARRQEVREQLQDSLLDIDVLIADEAHLMRNSETETFATARLLADISSKMLLLTATPVNNASRDLFSLLHLLDPVRFFNYELFESLRTVNSDVVRIERMLRKSPVPTGQLHELLETLTGRRSGGVFAENYFLDRLRALIEKSPALELTDRIEAQRLASKLNFLSGHVVRTRRVDVDEKRPVRTPHLCRIPPAPEEQALYQEVFELLRRHYNDFRLPAITIERIMASSIPAFIEAYGPAEPCLRGDYEDSDDRAEDDEETSEASAGIPGLAAILDHLGKPIFQQHIDSKLDTLLTAIRNLDHSDPGCKIIVFSYFRRTIAYLEGRLRENGYESVVVHGGVPTCPEDPERDEREVRQRRFQTDPAVRIMLSSEVGSEGLDFQFAHVLVNYDLPWNPMKVEQRIGRIDRIGQQAERLLVYSLVLQETIDETIYDRLLTKIGIFEQSLGDIESILGNEVEDIQRAVFDPRLSPPERAEVIDRAAEVLQRRRGDLEELEKDSAKTIGFDEYLRDEIERIRSERRYVGPDEIRSLVHRALTLPRLNLDPIETSPGIYEARITASARSFFEEYLTQDDRSAATSVFRGRLHGKQIMWTYEYEKAHANPEIELFNLRHPAVRAICKLLAQGEGSLKPTFRVQVRHRLDGSLPPEGVYVVGLYSVEYRGAYVRRELVSFAWDCGAHHLEGDAAAGALLGAVVLNGTDVEEEIRLPVALAQEAADGIEQAAADSFDIRRAELEGEETQLLRERREQLKAQAERQIVSERQREATLRQRLLEQQEGPQRQQLEALIVGVQTRIGNIRERLQKKLDETPATPAVALNWKLESIGMAVVTA